MAAMVGIDNNNQLYEDVKQNNSNGGGLRGILGLFNTVQPDLPTPSRQLEYLFEDEYIQTGPSWGARICYGAGMTYLLGLSVGGSWGLIDGLRNPAGRTARLRINCILNSCTARGPFVANNLAMVALLYNLVHGGVIRMREGKADFWSSVGSATLAGLIYKSTKGVKAMGTAGLVLGTGMFGFQTIKNYYNSNVVM